MSNYLNNAVRFYKVFIFCHRGNDFAGVKTEVSPRRSQSRIEYTARYTQEYDDFRTGSPSNFVEDEDIRPINVTSTGTQVSV